MQRSYTDDYTEEYVQKKLKLRRSYRKGQIFKIDKKERFQPTDSRAKLRALKVILERLTLKDIPIDKLHTLAQKSEEVGCNGTRAAMLAMARHTLSNYKSILGELARNDLTQYQFLAKIAVLEKCGESWPSMRNRARQLALEGLRDQQSKKNPIANRMSADVEGSINWRIWEG